VSHFKWNPPRQHTAAAASELRGNELVGSESRRTPVFDIRVLFKEERGRIVRVE
jgi:hypothetical protein